MDKEMRAKWAAALRSGRYKQGKGAYRTNVCYCAMGVLLDVIDPAGWELRFGNWAHRKGDEFIADIVDYGAVVEDNDEEGLTFDQIADKVEVGAYGV